MKYTEIETNALIVTAAVALLAVLFIVVGAIDVAASLAGGVVGSVAQKFASTRPGNGRKPHMDK